MSLGDAFRPPVGAQAPAKEAGGWGSAFEPVVKPKPAPKPK